MPALERRHDIGFVCLPLRLSLDGTHVIESLWRRFYFWGRALVVEFVMCQLKLLQYIRLLLKYDEYDNTKRKKRHSSNIAVCSDYFVWCINKLCPCMCGCNDLKYENKFLPKVIESFSWVELPLLLLLICLQPSQFSSWLTWKSEALLNIQYINNRQ